MHTPINFEYDLWTTKENEVTHYWVRVKITGEVTEVDRDIMRCLRSEEKRIRREVASVVRHGSVLSLDTPHDEERESWYADHCCSAEKVETTLIENEFRSLLTQTQLAVYIECLLEGKSESEYSREHGITRQSVCDTIVAIRKKAKKFFSDT